MVRFEMFAPSVKWMKSHSFVQAEVPGRRGITLIATFDLFAAYTRLKYVRYWPRTIIYANSCPIQPSTKLSEFMEIINTEDRAS